MPGSSSMRPECPRPSSAEGLWIPPSREGSLVSRRLDFTTGDVIAYVIVPLGRSGSFSLPSESGIEGLRYTREVNWETVAAAILALHVGTESQNDLRLQAVASARVRGRFVLAQPYKPQPHDVEPVLSLIPQGDDASLREGLARFQHGPGEDVFQVSGLFGAHRLDAQAPNGWIVDGIVLEDGRNVLDRTVQFEPGRTYDRVRVMLSPFSATISGRIQGVEEAEVGLQRAVDAVQRRVIVVPADEESWPIWRLTRVADAGPDGSFSVPGITPGRDYYVASCAWPCEGTLAYLRELTSGATRVFVDRPGVFTVTLNRE
jgi:hypothetical protein